MTLEQLSAAATCPNPWCASHKTTDPEIRAYHAPIIIPSGGLYHVACPVCPINGPESATEARAWAAWNTRTGQLVAVQPDDATVERYQHKKRGTVYEVIGSAELQVAGLAPDEGDHLAVYRGEDGKLWARPYDEFHDGRFEAMKGPKP